MLLVKKSGSKITPTFTVISKRKLVAHQKFTGRKIYLLLILYKTSIQPLNNNLKFVFKSNYGTETQFKHKKTIGKSDGFFVFYTIFSKSFLSPKIESFWVENSAKVKACCDLRCMQTWAFSCLEFSLSFSQSLQVKRF